jgi:hypothetical protein
MSERYILIATVAGTYYGSAATAGQVVNAVIWDGDTSTWAPPAGTEARSDPTDTLQIGQTTTV